MIVSYSLDRRLSLSQSRFGLKRIISNISSRRRRDSSVGIATGYGLDEQGGGRQFESRNGQKIFTFPYRPDRVWGPPNLL
jgi:hypothetical protein